MKFFKLIQLLSLVTISFLSVDVDACCGNKERTFNAVALHEQTASLNASVYPPGTQLECTITTQQPGQPVGRYSKKITEVKTFNHTVVFYDNKVFEIGRELTGREGRTRTVIKHVCCCCCQPIEGIVIPCCILCAIVQDCCGCVRTIEYEIEG